VALVVGVIIGVVASRARSHPQEPAPPQREAAAVPDSPAAAQIEPEAGWAPPGVRIGMEDVVSELERRYQGKRVEDDEEKPRRRAPPVTTADDEPAAPEEV
jgi:hypothetical protein